MSDLLEDAIARLRALPEAEREACAGLIVQFLSRMRGQDDFSPDELAAIDEQLRQPRDDASEEEMAAFFAQRRSL